MIAGVVGSGVSSEGGRSIVWGGRTGAVGMISRAGWEVVEAVKLELKVALEESDRESLGTGTCVAGAGIVCQESSDLSKEDCWKMPISSKDLLDVEEAEDESLSWMKGDGVIVQVSGSAIVSTLESLGKWSSCGTTG
jgi:hypothetical protein